MMNRAWILAAFATVATSCGGKNALPDKPLDIEIKLVSVPPNARDKRLPITFDQSSAYELTVDLRVRNPDGSTRTRFTGANAWARVTFAPSGQVVSSSGPAGANDPNVEGPNVHFTNGEAKGIKLKVIGAYGDTRVVVEDVGFVPAPKGKVAACADGKDNDKNGYADFPHDPSCLFLNDDSEAPFEAGFGTSDPIFFSNPTIRDVQLGTASPFLAKQVDLEAASRRLIVTAVTNQGMFVTDIDEPTRSSNSLFIFNFSTPYRVRMCDRLVRLSGNVADFFGGTQLGTPGWTLIEWRDEARSGPCLVPDFTQIDGKFSNIVEQVEALEASLVTVKNPTVGTHFGAGKVPVVDGNPTPADGKSDCDLNNDGIVGFNRNRGGFSEVERLCNDRCTLDPDCTEWNNFRSFGQVKIKFAPGDGTLFLEPGALPGFDIQEFVGPNKLAEVRGVLTNFVGPQPPYKIEPRCLDDVIPFGSTNIKDVKTACLRNRTGEDDEGHN